MKKPKESKTINFGLLLLIFGAVQSTLPSLQISAEMFGWVNMAVAIAIIVLRYKTNQPIGK